MIADFRLYYTRGHDSAIDDDIIVPLQDYLYAMPNLNALRESNEEVYKTSMTDGGNLAAIPFLKMGSDGKNEGAWIGMVIRQDWLDTLGMAAPKTYAQMEEVLAAMQQNFPNAQNPMFIPTSGFSYGGAGMSAGYNVINNLFQVDGVVKYGFLEPSMKDYLAMMTDWYKKGFISPEFYVTPSAGYALPWADTGVVARGEQGVFDMIYTHTPTFVATAEDASFAVTALPPLVKNEGDKVHFRQFTPYCDPSGAISADCKNVELMCKYWDYFFSEEGKLLGNFGVEGVTFEYDSNGEPKWIGELLPGAEGYNMSNVQYKHLLYNQPGYIMFDRERQVLDPQALDLIAVWDTAGYDYNYTSAATMTAGEGSEYATIMGDINTLISETVVKFVTGEKSLDEYDAFVAQLKSMGIERAVEIKQAALDRYNAR